MTRLIIIGAATLWLAGCTTVPEPVPTVPPPPPCPITSVGNWKAWVDAMPGPDRRPTLIVTGRVQLPADGWQLVWREPQILLTQPAQVVVSLDAIPPTANSGKPVAAQDVRGSWPVTPPISSVEVHCRDQVLTRIAPVETAL